MPPRSLRKRSVSIYDDDEDATPALSVEDTRILQQQRQRPKGVDVASLLTRPAEEAERASALAVTALATADEGGLHAAFKRERQQDEGTDNPHMQQYVEAQLAARLGRPAPGSDAPTAPRTIEDEIFADSEYKRKDDLELGPSWITGITEVPLSLDQRLKNIEDTETAKKKMLTSSGIARPGFGDEDDDAEDGGGQQALRRGQYPVFFGKQDPAMLKRVQEAQAAKKQKQAYYADKRAKKRQEDPKPSW